MTKGAIQVFAASLVLCSCSRHSSLVSRSVQPTPHRIVQREAVNAVDAGDGDYDLRQLRAKLDANPGDLQARFALAHRYEALGFHEVAIEHGRLAIERVPESEEAHVELAKLLWRAERSGEAAKSLGEFGKTRELGATGWAWLGLVRDDSGDWKGGEAAYRKALAIAPDRDDLHNNLGYCLLRQGKRKEAEAEFRSAVQLNPQSVVARNNLGSVLTSNPSEAVANLQSVSDPATAHNNLAAAFIEAGKYAEARHELDEALRYNRQHPAALSNLELVSKLDGKPADIKLLPRKDAPDGAVAGRSGKRGGSWVARTWRHLRGVRPTANGFTNTGVEAANGAGSAIAPRDQGSSQRQGSN